MTFEELGRVGVREETCRYKGSRLAFRGPRRDLQQDYIAFLGGTETFGKFVDRPFPALLEERTGRTCVNLGWPNAGIDVVLNDRGLMRMAGAARLTVLQVPNAANLSNRFYTVHPRRNDRFLKAREPLRRLYPELDFTEFSFTRHMLVALKGHCTDRFALVHQDLAQVWIARMRRVIGKLGGPVILLWFSDRAPERACDRPEMQYDPALVSRGMLEALTDVAAGMARAPRGGTGEHTGLAERLFQQIETPAARDLPGQAAHAAAAQALIPLVTEYWGR
ncbi:DUF6473 family protein [Roseovarius aestuariivivens]|uniref:DUF6473 family protein n=1 Tax=Roseovarius aestuariivivens TaxID=1888910 RepID=UPI001080B635|nr:DUF6473 family protein [Roseovarius aestuariivivens]